MTRRQILAGAAVSVLGASTLTGCGGKGGKLDPEMAALPTAADVDGKLSNLVPARRKRRLATYSMEAPSAVKGAAKPLVTIVEYSDFQCPHCSTLAQALDELVTAYPEDVRIVFRQFPLGFHKQADPAARAALAAGRQQRFWAMHDEMFNHRSALADENLLEYAEAIGLSMGQFEKDWADPAIAERVAAEMGRGRELGVSGTPAMFINGYPVEGMPKPEVLTDVIDGERKVALAMIEEGSKREEVYARFMKAAGGK